MQPRIDCALLAFKPRVVDAGSSAGPPVAATAEQSRGDRGRCRGVADAHLSQAKQIAVLRDSLVAGDNGAQEARLVHGGSLGEIFRWTIELQRDDAQNRAR